MTPSHQVVHLRIPASPEFIVVARLAVSGVASRMNFTVEEIEDIKIALSEACTNAIQHGYISQKEGASMVDIAFLVHADRIEITVKDTGIGFDPLNVTSKKTQELSEEQFGLGLGLAFINNLMDESDIQSKPGDGTMVKMVKYLTQTIPA